MIAIINIDKPYVMVRQATKRGWIECELPGVADLSYSKSKLRRGRTEDEGGVSPTLTAHNGLYVLEEINGDRGMRIRKNKETGKWQLLSENGFKVMRTFTDEEAEQLGNLKGKKISIRKLTPEECFKLQGMTADDVEKCRAVGVSNSQLYSQAGNGLTTTCPQFIMEHLFKATEDQTYECTDERMRRLGYGIQ